MSSANNKSGIPSNEELVDELTKDLRSSAIKADTSHLSESDSESEPRMNEETPETREEDYIDDAQLKERDEHLSEEEKRVGIMSQIFHN